MPVPTFAGVESLLDERGWQVGHGGEVLVTPLDRLLATMPARPDLPPVEFLPAPDADWLAAYHYRGGVLPPLAVAILRGVVVEAVERGARQAWLQVDPENRPARLYASVGFEPHHAYRYLRQPDRS